MNDDQPIHYQRLAKHILLNLHRSTVVSCARGMAAPWGSCLTQRLALRIGGTQGALHGVGGRPSMVRLWLAKAGVSLGLEDNLEGISNNTHLPRGLESLKHVNQQGRRSATWLRWAFSISRIATPLWTPKTIPLVKVNAAVPWEAFRSRLERVWRKPADKRKSNAGCKPWDAIVMFKAIILCALYNLSDDQVEYQMRDRLSFVRFLALTLEDKVPDAKTVWLYREQLSQAGLIDALFEDFDGYLKSQGYQAMGGQIIDASIVAVPMQRNRRDDNEQIKRGETPESWADKPAKRRQKDRDARWTKKHGKSHYGYKNHVTIDRRHKLIRRYRVTDATVHDSQVIEELLTSDNTASGVWADSA